MGISICQHLLQPEDGTYKMFLLNVCNDLVTCASVILWLTEFVAAQNTVALKAPFQGPILPSPLCLFQSEESQSLKSMTVGHLRIACCEHVLMIEVNSGTL